jgi:hypothetical protein
VGKHPWVCVISGIGTLNSTVALGNMRQVEQDSADKEFIVDVTYITMAPSSGFKILDHFTRYSDGYKNQMNPEASAGGQVSCGGLRQWSTSSRAELAAARW